MGVGSFGPLLWSARHLQVFDAADLLWWLPRTLLDTPTPERRWTRGTRPDAMEHEERDDEGVPMTAPAPAAPTDLLRPALEGTLPREAAPLAMAEAAPSWLARPLVARTSVRDAAISPGSRVSYDPSTALPCLGTATAELTAAHAGERTRLARSPAHRSLPGSNPILGGVGG